MRKSKKFPLLLSFILTVLIGFYYGNMKPETVQGQPIILTKYVDRPVFTVANSPMEIPGRMSIDIDLESEKITMEGEPPVETTVNIYKKANQIVERVKAAETIIIRDTVFRGIDSRVLNRVMPLPKPAKAW